MFNRISQANQSQKLLVNKYNEYRLVGKELTKKITKKFLDVQSIRTVGKLLGVLKEKTIMLDSEEDINFIMDFNLFEYQINGKNMIERYLEENPEVDEKEAIILAAQSLSYTSLFKIIDSDPVNSSLTLSDLLNNGSEVKIININLSQTAFPELLIFTRIVPFSDFNMLSGMFCIFPEDSEKELLKQFKIGMRKVKSEIESVQRFIAFFKLNRKVGLKTRTIGI